MAYNNLESLCYTDSDMKEAVDAEREACMKIAETVRAFPDQHREWSNGFDAGAAAVANAIRERGKS